MNKQNIFVNSVENPEYPLAKGKSLATVTSVTLDGLQLRVDGEPTARQKLYKRLVSYDAPQTGDRVYIVETSGTFIVLGKIV